MGWLDIIKSIFSGGDTHIQIAGTARSAKTGDNSELDQSSFGKVQGDVNIDKRKSAITEETAELVERTLIASKPDEPQVPLTEYKAAYQQIVQLEGEKAALKEQLTAAIQPTPQENEKLLDESSPEIQQMLTEAKRLANDGKLTEAETLFARTVVGRRDQNAYNRYGNFLARVGRLAQAEDMYKSVFDAAELTDDDTWRAIAYGNLGNIYQTRGELDKSEQMYHKAMEIDERLGRQEGMADQYGNLGLIYWKRGELDKAEKMLRKSLEIEERLGQQQGIAIQYGNLGLIYQTRGDLDKAEKMHSIALEIEKSLGRQEGIANEYGSLGWICRTRGEMDKARELWTKARDIFAKIGIAHMADMIQSWLDELDKSDKKQSDDG